MSKIYVASSWRNECQPAVVEILRTAGHEVYDFRHPTPGDRGFSWSDIDPLWKFWRIDQIKDALRDSLAVDGFDKDFGAMLKSDIVVLCLPAGASAHLEAGWARGAGKPLVIYCPIFERVEPELMYSMATEIVGDTDALVSAIKRTGK